jgi:hypothetical protein
MIAGVVGGGFLGFYAGDPFAGPWKGSRRAVFTFAAVGAGAGALVGWAVCR